MSDLFSIYSQEGIIAVDFSKSPSVDIFKNAIDDVSLCENNMLRLWDMTCRIDLTTAEVRALARYAKSKLKTPFSKVAIVAPDDLTFGLFRLHEVEREDRFLKQRVFRTKQDALAWLKRYTFK